MAFNHKDIELPELGSHKKSDNDRRLQMILEHAPSYIAYVNEKLIFEYANTRYCEYWNLPREKIVGRRVVEVVGEKRFAITQDVLARAESGETISREVVSTASGTRRIIEVKYIPNIEDERLVGLYIFGNEVTQLRDSQRRQELLIESLPAMVFLVDVNELVLFSNKMSSEMSNISQSEIIGMKVRDLLHPDGYAVAKPHLDAAFAGEPQVYENRLLNHEGELIDIEVHMSPEVDQSGDIVGVLVMSFEITRLKQATADLRQVEERFELAIGGSRAGIYELDPQRPDYLLCEHIEKLLNIPRGILNDSRSEADKRIHPDDLPRVFQFRKDHKLEAEFAIEFQALTGDSGYRWFRSAARHIFDEDGNLTRIL